MKKLVTTVTVVLALTATATTTVLASGFKNFTGKNPEAAEEWLSFRPKIERSEKELVRIDKFSSLTDEQKTELKTLNDEKASIREIFNEKATAAGIITQKQAEPTPERQNRIASKTFDIGKYIFNDTELNEEQKALVEEYKTAIKEICLKEINLYFEYGVISEETAQTMKDRIDEGFNFNINFNFREHIKNK